MTEIMKHYFQKKKKKFPPMVIQELLLQFYESATCSFR